MVSCGAAYSFESYGSRGTAEFSIMEKKRLYSLGHINIFPFFGRLMQAF